MNMITNEYTLIHSYKEVYQAVLDEAKNENIDLRKDYKFNDAAVVTTKDGKDGVVISYKRNIDDALSFFIFEFVGDQIISLSAI